MKACIILKFQFMTESHSTNLSAIASVVNEVDTNLQMFAFNLCKSRMSEIKLCTTMRSLHWAITLIIKLTKRILLKDRNNFSVIKIIVCLFMPTYIDHKSNACYVTPADIDFLITIRTMQELSDGLI